MWCRQCRDLRGSREPRSPELGKVEQAQDDLSTCARCGAPLTTEDHDDLLARRLQKFGLLDERGTLLERKERSALDRSRRS